MKGDAKQPVMVNEGKSLIIGSINDMKRTIGQIEKYVKKNEMDAAKTCAISLEEQSKDLYRAILGALGLE